MKIDAVITPPENHTYEMALLPGSSAHVAPGWQVTNNAEPGTGPLWLLFYADVDSKTQGSRIWVWDAAGGKESLYAEIAPDEGHPYEVREEQDGPIVTRQEVATRGKISVRRVNTFQEAR